MVDSMKEKVASKRKACANFFDMMGDSFVYDSEYLKFHWSIGGLQGVITVVPCTPGRVLKFTD